MLFPSFHLATILGTGGHSCLHLTGEEAEKQRPHESHGHGLVSGRLSCCFYGTTHPHKDNPPVQEPWAPGSDLVCRRFPAPAVQSNAQNPQH